MISVNEDHSSSNLTRNVFNWSQASVASLCFGVRALPRVKLALILSVTLLSVSLFFNWRPSDGAPEFLADKATTKILSVGASVLTGAIEWLVVLPMIWSTAYRSLVAPDVKPQEKYGKREWRAAIAVVKTYGLVALLSLLGDLSLGLIKYLMISGMIFSFQLDFHAWRTVELGFSLLPIPIITYIWAVFLLAIPLAMQGQRKVLSDSASKTKGYILRIFCGIFLITISVTILQILFQKSFGLLPNPMKTAADVTLVVIKAILSVIETLATVYFARCVQLHLASNNSVELAGTDPSL
jgi:hypothetical protein